MPVRLAIVALICENVRTPTSGSGVSGTGPGGADGAIAFESLALGGGAAYGYRFGAELAQEQANSA